jgi:Kae1-associated kinase Bud32
MHDKQTIGRGAEATIYLIKEFGVDVAVKFREPKTYRIPELDTVLRSRRTKKEASLLCSAVESGVNAPRLIAVGKYSIYMESIKGDTLNHTKLSGTIAKAAGIMLGKLHNHGIIHGDFTPANLMFCYGKLFVIDFGLGDFNNGSEERALDILLMKRQVSKAIYSIFIKNYSAVAKSYKETLIRLTDIEKRGRYQSRTMV